MNIKLQIAFFALAGLLLIAVFSGPLSAYSLPARLQSQDLEKILKREGLLVNGKIIKKDNPLTCENSVLINEKVRYLNIFYH